MKRNWPLFLTAAGFCLFVLSALLDANASGYIGVLCAIGANVGFVMCIVGLGSGVFKRSPSVPLRLVSGLGFIFVMGLCFVAYCYGGALRNAAILFGKSALKEASIDYRERGYVTNRSKHSEVWRSSNVVTIAGRQYECAFTVRSERFHDEGVLAMTTNGMFIWLDAKRGSKLIDEEYRPPFFPPRF